VSQKRRAVSSGRRNGLGEDLIWFPPAEGLSRAPVELARDGIEIPLRLAGEIRPLREVLAEQARSPREISSRSASDTRDGEGGCTRGASPPVRPMSR
jgi:hypothetical protein